MASDQSPFADTVAARMLAAALKRASDEQAMSLRQVAKILNYKQAVVLSHMSLGRVPIPIDRAVDIADALGLNKSAFLRAVLEQRHPDVDWSLLGDLGGTIGGNSSLAEELGAILGSPLSTLNTSQRRVMREVVNDTRPDRRWLSVHELPVVEMIRDWIPKIREDGLSDEDRSTIARLLSRRSNQ